MAMIKVGVAGVTADAIESCYYVQIESKKNDPKNSRRNRIFTFPGAMKILTEKNGNTKLIQSIEITSTKWLNNNQLVALSYSDGRVIGIDANTLKATNTLRQSKWKWKAINGTVRNYLEQKNILEKSKEHDSLVFITEDGRDNSVRTIGFFEQKYCLFQSNTVFEVIDTKCGSIVFQGKCESVARISGSEFGLFINKDDRYRLNIINSKNFETIANFDLPKFASKSIVNPDCDFRLISMSKTSGVINVLLEKDGSVGFSFLNKSKFVMPIFPKKKGKLISGKNTSGIVFSSNNQTVRFLKFPEIIEMPISKK